MPSISAASNKVSFEFRMGQALSLTILFVDTQHEAFALASAWHFPMRPACTGETHSSIADDPTLRQKRRDHASIQSGEVALPFLRKHRQEHLIVRLSAACTRRSPGKGQNTSTR